MPALALFGLFGFSRLALVLFYRENLTDAALGPLFVLGARIDAMLLAYLSVVPVILSLGFARRRLTVIVTAGYWTVVTCLVVFLELATISSLNDFDQRPNRLMFEYLGYPREVFGMLWNGYRMPLLVALGTVITAAWVCSTGVSRLWRRSDAWSRGSRLAALLPTLVVLFFVARGTLSHRAANISLAAYSGNHLANELALDSTYSLLYAVYSLKDETDPAKLYGGMPPDEMLEIVRQSEHLAPVRGSSAGIPLLHRQTSGHPRERPLNLVVILEESLGAEFVGCLGGLPLTPNFDRLSKEGTLLRNLYATGFRTVRGIEATVAGFLPTPGRSVVKLDGSQYGFFTLADLLSRRGYATEFIYGGESHFDNMRSFFRGNGFQDVHDEPTFPETGFHGTWGVGDEDLFVEVDRILRGHGENPFFALILTTSNHTPFEYPPGRIEPYEEPPNTRLNAMKYADYALGRFFAMAKRADYYRDTIFVVVADHNDTVHGTEIVPVDEFRIPGLVLGPGVPAGEYTDVASQIDLAPTALDLMGLDVEHPMIGHSLFGPEELRPNRAVMQFGNAHAFLSGHRVVVHVPDRPAKQFDYTEGRLTPTELDPRLERDALAHALLPGWLYRNHLYRLPDRLLRTGA